MSEPDKNEVKQGETTEKSVKQAEPVHNLSPFEEMDRMFESFFSRGWLSPLHWPRPLWSDWEAPLERKLLPRVDIIERDQEIVVRAQIPGVKKEDIDVSLSGNAVTIRGETSHEQKEEKGDYYRRECSHGSFTRTIALPENVDSDKVKATFNDGMLELTIPKTAEGGRRKITIE